MTKRKISKRSGRRGKSAGSPQTHLSIIEGKGAGLSSKAHVWFLRLISFGERMTGGGEANAGPAPTSHFSAPNLHPRVCSAADSYGMRRNHRRAFPKFSCPVARLQPHSYHQTGHPGPLRRVCSRWERRGSTAKLLKALRPIRVRLRKRRSSNNLHRTARSPLTMAPEES